MRRSGPERLRSGAAALALLGCAAALGCGHYGPPIRTSELEARAAEEAQEAAGAEAAVEESEGSVPTSEPLDEETGFSEGDEGAGAP